jgi:signal transduction protein with GAF and PtsI domain
MEQHLERRLQALQRINSISNSTMDQDQTLEIIAGKVSEELGAGYCSIFYYDELQRTLTLRATNGPRPLGGMHYLLHLGEGYSGWVADTGSPLLVHDALAMQILLLKRVPVVKSFVGYYQYQSFSLGT